MSNVITRTAHNLMDWFNERAPGFMPFYHKHMDQYYAPKNFNIWYVFGVLSMVALVNQIVGTVSDAAYQYAVDADARLVATVLPSPRSPRYGRLPGQK